jgi:hypothetical protein
MRLLHEAREVVAQHRELVVDGEQRVPGVAGELAGDPDVDDVVTKSLVDDRGVGGLEVADHHQQRLGVAVLREHFHATRHDLARLADPRGIAALFVA